jgi:glycosyltransferase involved in cell wall biosynthesis
MAINPFIAELLAQKGIDRKKIYLKTNYSQDFGFKNYDNREDFYFFAGRLQAEKGVQHMVEGFKILKKKLLIAGNGELKEWVKENETGEINYIGHQSGEDMKKLYLKCKAVIFPSIWLEGMPMAIIEAQSAGVIPIVASTETTRAMISHQEDGFLYQAGNTESLVDTILAFELMTAEELNTISTNARQKFMDDYNEEQHIRVIEKIYN